MTEDYEALARERLAAAGFRPLQPFPGVGCKWPMACVDCGNEYYRKPQPSTLLPCYCKQMVAKKAALAVARAERAAAQQDKADHELFRRHLAELVKRKKYIPLEEYPGPDWLPEGVRWWMYCWFCHRIWHVPVEDMRTCPHKGDDHEFHEGAPSLPDGVKPRPIKGIRR